MTKLKVSCFIIAMLFPFCAYSGGWQGATKITNYVIEGGPQGERFYVMFATDFNPDGCTDPNKHWKRVTGDTTKGKYIISAVMSAKAAGQNVVPLLLGCDDWNRPKLEGLWIQE